MTFEQLSQKEKDILSKVKTEYFIDESEIPHECDNVPNPFDDLELEEVEYIQDHPWILDVFDNK